MDELVARVVRLATQGIYQHGEYAKERPELRTRELPDIPGQDESTDTFIVEPEDGSGDQVTVTVRRTR